MCQKRYYGSCSEETISSRFSDNYEANASELWENLEEMSLLIVKIGSWTSNDCIEFGSKGLTVQYRLSTNSIVHVY